MFCTTLKVLFIGKTTEGIFGCVMNKNMIKIDGILRIDRGSRRVFGGGNILLLVRMSVVLQYIHAILHGSDNI